MTQYVVYNRWRKQLPANSGGHKLSKITSNKKLIGVLTGQWGDHGLPPSQSSFMMHAMIVHHYFDGGNYPIGGCRKIAETIVPFIRKLVCNQTRDNLS